MFSVALFSYDLSQQEFPTQNPNQDKPTAAAHPPATATAAAAATRQG